MTSLLRFTIDLIQKPDDLSDSDIADVAKILSEVEISKLFKGEINTSLVKRYFGWAVTSYQNGKAFMYVVRNEYNNIVACFDLQKQTEHIATIGFWKSSRTSIRMHQILLEVFKKAKELNFETLDAYTETENAKAVQLLIRTGFTNKGPVMGRTKQLLKFERAI